MYLPDTSIIVRLYDSTNPMCKAVQKNSKTKVKLELLFRKFWLNFGLLQLVRKMSTVWE
jgi:hypothetical protein